MRKWIMLVSGVVIIALAVGGYQWFVKKPEKSAAPTVNTAKVKRGDLSVTVSGTGTVGPVNRQTVKVLKGGQIKEVLVQEGDAVKKGQLLCTFEAKDNSDQIQQEELNLSKARLDLADAQQQFKDQAFGSNVDDLKSNIKKLQLSVDQSLQKIQTLEADQQPSDPVVAPMDGVISTLSVDANQQLNDGGEFGVITDYQHLQVVIQVDELDISKVQKGQNVQITLDALPNQAIEGTVEKISAEGTASNGVAVFDVTISLKNVQNVRAGMTAEAEIKVADKPDALMVPIEAVHQIRGRNVVFLSNTVNTGSNTTGAPQRSPRPNGNSGAAENAGNFGNTGNSGNAESSGNAGNSGNSGTPPRNVREVQVGIHNESYIEIVSGLKEGDEVILPMVAGSSSANSNVRGAGFGGPGIGGFGGGFGGGGVRVTGGGGGSRGGGR
ncbi:efflux RND transporter periplasmic adaptor subunit [Ferviditalea candida]|uniref:Efflux RND transporter periplasmic adaptor subunit n=1 Tax=Ferviditalea candida TaxID=3108399 RepID=A0ABU5ZC16_9BACL|nr:efflux RND transporter periplasmic adaptor subunit [Paenibacillaceae bacterium T2]